MPGRVLTVQLGAVKYPFVSVKFGAKTKIQGRVHISDILDRDASSNTKKSKKSKKGSSSSAWPLDGFDGKEGELVQAKVLSVETGNQAGSVLVHLSLKPSEVAKPDSLAAPSPSFDSLELGAVLNGFVSRGQGSSERYAWVDVSPQLRGRLNSSELDAASVKGHTQLEVCVRAFNKDKKQLDLVRVRLLLPC